MEILDCEQGSEEWFHAHDGLPSGSRLGKIVTPRTGKLSAGHKTLIGELIAEQVEPNRERISSYWMDRGRLLEPEARAWYELETGNEVDQVGMILNHGFGYSPDGLIGEFGQGVGTLEIKCPKPSTHVKWLLEGTIPDEHKAQWLRGLMDLRERFLRLPSYCPGLNPLFVRVTTEDPYYSQLVESLEEFRDAYDAATKRILGNGRDG